MDKSTLVRLFGFPATVMQSNPGVLDRWLWLRTRLPGTTNGEKLIDIGCGTGAFSIGAALRGYDALGLSWDERNQRVAGERAKICKADSARFEVLDVRHLGTREDLLAKFDIAICFENIEHIIDDRKLVHEIAACLKPGGRLLLTTPYLFYRPMTSGDNGPFPTVEDGGHVRRGYTEAMLRELCIQAHLTPKEVSYCTGLLSQKITFIQRVFSRIHPLLGWAIVLPLRIFQPLDRAVTSRMGWPYWSICLEADKPRHDATLETSDAQGGPLIASQDTIDAR